MGVSSVTAKSSSHADYICLSESHARQICTPKQPLSCVVVAGYMEVHLK